MKKNLNAITIVFSVAAVVFILGDVFAVISVLQSRAQALSGMILWVALWSQARPTLTSAGQLFGLGVLIELVDQLRWNSLPAEAREGGRAGVCNLRYLFRWPVPS